jgi:hypothetical protein
MAHEVPLVLMEIHRVLRPLGFALFQVPDLQRLAELVVADRLDEPLVDSPLGPCSARDLIYGHGPSLSRGQYFRAHCTGFTARTLGDKLLHAGFAMVEVNRSGLYLWVLAEKTARTGAVVGP